MFGLFLGDVEVFDNIFSEPIRSPSDTPTIQTPCKTTEMSSFDVDTDRTMVGINKDCDHCKYRSTSGMIV